MVPERVHGRSRNPDVAIDVRELLCGKTLTIGSCGGAGNVSGDDGGIEGNFVSPGRLFAAGHYLPSTGLTT